MPVTYEAPARNLRGVLIDEELYGAQGVEPCVSEP